MKTIRSKLMVLTLIIMWLSTTLVGSSSIVLNLKSTKNLLKSSIGQVAVIAANSAERDLETYKAMIEEIACLPEFSSREKTMAYKQELIQDRINKYGYLTGDIVDVGSGRALYSGNDYNDRDWFQHAKKGETYISDPVVGKSTGKLSFIVASPIWQDGIKDSSIYAVIFFSLDISKLQSAVSDIKFSDDTVVYMLDSHGNMIAHSEDYSKVEERVNMVQVAETNPEVEPLARVQQKMINGETGYMTFQYQGQEQCMGYSKVDGTAGWSIAVTAPIGDFMEETNVSVFVTLCIIVAVMVVSFILILRLSSRISKPIAICSDRLEKLAAGDVKSPVTKINKGCREVLQLSQSTYSLVNSFNEYIDDVVYILNNVADGNLQVHSKNPDVYAGDFSQLFTALGTIVTKLSATMSQVVQAADQVNSGAEQVSAGAQTLSDGATRQAASVQELTATINDISDKVKVNAENARAASEKVTQVGKEMLASNQKMKEMTAAMSEINESSEEIRNIIKSIEDISRQTNILSLNAAVEAARAGDAGKGFAVVAGEVRSLAAQSAAAAKSTASLINNSITAIQRGTMIADEAAGYIMRTVSGTQEIVTSINDINEASQEQAESINQVTAGMDQINSVVQTNSATAEESAAASEQLSGQSQVMKDLISQFRLSEGNFDERLDEED